MRERGVVLLSLLCSVASCQLIWTYDGLTQQAGVGGASSSSRSSASRSSSESSASSSGGPSSSAGGGFGGAGGSSSDAGDAGCVASKEGGACIDSCDRAELTAHASTVEGDVYTCTLLAAGKPNPTCIEQDDHFSTACADCWAAIGSCASQHCAGFCGLGDVNSSGCNTCLIDNCDCSFTACSGIIRPASKDAGVDAPCD